MRQRPVFLSHPLLRPDTVEDRPYQATLAAKLVQAPHLLVLPTGLGKTVVALRALLPFLEHAPPKRVLVLAPTKPLVEQHGRFFRHALLNVPIAVFTGQTPPLDRDRAWAESRLIVATPQVIQNDLVRGTRDLSDVSFLIYDEAHRAAGRYPYGFIAQRYAKAGGRAACGLTASPANDGASLQKLLASLRLERVEIRTERDPDVAPHVHEVATEWIRLRPTATAVRTTKLLERVYGRAILALRRLGYFPMLRGLPSRKDLLRLGQRLRAEASQRQGGRTIYEAVSLQARAVKLEHALEMAETQGSLACYSFLARIEQEALTSGGTRAARDLVREPEFMEALALSRDDPEPSAKLQRVCELVQAGLGTGQRRILVFANYRETADALVAALSKLAGVRPHRFVGHARSGDGRGLSAREQAAVVDRFRTGDLNVLVATAVGEEGLDLPETDAVIFHEPVASGIRFVQRRGRTGRHSDGRVYVLIMEGTRDEAYHWSALRRERKMLGNLAALKRLAPLPLSRASSDPPPVPVPPRASPLASGLEMTLDVRETGSALARSLLERGVRLRTANLPTGDFALSDRVLVERKSAKDLAQSLKDGRLFDQLPRLGRAGCGILLVEGDPFRATEGISGPALAGALAAAVADHHVSLVTVPDAEAAADFLVSLARREHQEGRPRPLRVEKAPLSPEAQLRFVVEGFPHVGPVTAHRLLERFGSVEALVRARPDQLVEIEGVGPETAERLHELLHRSYAPPSSGTSPQPPQVGVVSLEGGQGAARA